ncbi:hypothetical protein [Archangium minus]|uniref:hypothetical protein n=1 Tax=Archangium minus TaxID=83450 RepID=UPI0037BF51C6
MSVTGPDDRRSRGVTYGPHVPKQGPVAPKQAKKQEEPKKKEDAFDKLADKNDGYGVRANFFKIASDVTLGNQGKANRSAAYTFGNWQISKGGKQTVELRNTPFTRWAGVGGGMMNAVQLPTALGSMVSDWRKAARGEGTYNKAVGSTASFASLTTNVVKGGVETVQQFRAFREMKKGTLDAIRAHAPDADPKAANKTARAAANRYLGKSAKVTQSALKHTIKGAGDDAIKSAAQPIAKAALKSGATAAAKAGGRFVPGANVAIAAMDGVAMASTLADKNATVGKKVCSVITFAGSVAAATNIPIVSQAGAVVSTVSSVVGGLFGDKDKPGIAQKAADKVGGFFKKLF